MYVHMTQNVERKIMNIFLSISFDICFGCSKEPPHRDGSFEYPQHIFLLRNKIVLTTHSIGLLIELRSLYCMTNVYQLLLYIELDT